MCSSLMQFICELVEGSTSIQQQVLFDPIICSLFESTVYLMGNPRKSTFVQHCSPRINNLALYPNQKPGFGHYLVNIYSHTLKG